MATLQEQAKSINDLIDQAQKAVNNGDVETARKLKEEIQQAKDTYNEQKEIVDSVSAEEKISGDSEAPKEKTETEAKNEKPEAETVPEKNAEAKPDVDKEPKADEKEAPEEKPETPIEETAEALDQLVREGKTLYVGISNYNGAQTAAITKIFKDLHTPFIIHQPRYNMFDRHIEDDLLPVLKQEGKAAVCFSPLAQGLLTDRYLNGIPADSRAAKSTSPLLHEDR